jgi:SAM-dependent methyltransferase
MKTLPVPPAPADEFSHAIPHANVVDRTVALERLAAGKRVLHVGFVDEGRMTDRMQREEWLHSRLAAVSGELVGLDRDPGGVSAARNLGFEAYAADCQDQAALSALGIDPAELIIAGELIEHLDQPGLFLEAVKGLLRPDGALVITTPNATRVLNILGSVLNREFVNDDHVCWFSWHTLSALLTRHGWQLDDLAYYVAPRRSSSRQWPARVRAQIHAANLARQGIALLARARPAVADGLVVTASLRARHPGEHRRAG